MIIMLFLIISVKAQSQDLSIVNSDSSAQNQSDFPRQQVSVVNHKFDKILGEIRKEIEILNCQLEQNPFDGTKLYKRGVLNSNLGEYVLAIEDLNRAQKLIGENAGIEFYRGFSFYYSQEYEKALINFDKSVKLKNDYAETYVMRGLTLWELGKETEAFKDFTRAIELDPKNAKAYEWRSMLYPDGHESESNADYEKYLELTDEP